MGLRRLPHLLPPNPRSLLSGEAVFRGQARLSPSAVTPSRRSPAQAPAHITSLKPGVWTVSRLGWDGSRGALRRSR